MKKIIKYKNKNLFCNKNYFIVIGTIISGFGRGKSFLKNNYYKSKLSKILKKEIYCGTLNVILNNLNYNIFSKYIEMRKINCINGFYDNNNQYFGSVKYFKCVIKGILSIVVIPELTKHKLNLLEIVTTLNLRKKFKLYNNKKIKIKIR